MSTLTVRYQHDGTGQNATYQEPVNARCESTDARTYARFSYVGVTIPVGLKSELFIPWHRIRSIEGTLVRPGTLQERVTGIRGSE